MLLLLLRAMLAYVPLLPTLFLVGQKGLDAFLAFKEGLPSEGFALGGRVMVDLDDPA